MVRIAINGFGRIGRNAFKIAFDRNFTHFLDKMTYFIYKIFESVN